MGLHVFPMQADSLPAEPQGKPKNAGVGSHSLLHGVFPTQKWNQGLLHCRLILYQMRYQESPFSKGQDSKYLGGLQVI